MTAGHHTPAEPVRVVHVGPDPRGRGGMPAVIGDLLSSPLRERHRLDMIVTYRTALPLSRLVVFVRSLGTLARWCAGRGPRVVHVHTAVRGSLYRKSICVALVRMLRRPVILHVHAGAGDISDFAERIGPLRRALFARAFALADRVLSVSDAGAQEVAQRFGVEGIIVIPHPAPRVAATLPIPRPVGAQLRILYVGGFADPAKGGLVLVAALPDILASCPTAQVTLAGPGAPPPAAQSVIVRFDRVRWVGWLDGEEKAGAFATADVVVLPSITEGLPVALLEAMAYGRAIVATTVGGIGEMLTDGRHAVLIAPNDPRALADATRALLNDPQRRAELGRQARARAETPSVEEVCMRLREIYSELASLR